MNTFFAGLSLAVIGLSLIFDHFRPRLSREMWKGKPTTFLLILAGNILVWIFFLGLITESLWDVVNFIPNFKEFTQSGIHGVKWLYFGAVGLLALPAIVYVYLRIKEDKKHKQH